MNAYVPDSALASFSEYIRSRMGIHFPRERWDELERKIGAAAAALGFPDAGSCITWILSSRTDRRQLEVLASCITVGETYFFRDEHSFAALGAIVFPAIAAAHSDGDRRARIWSAGCSTGEEAYSLAMLVSESPCLAGFDVCILATDINLECLKKAAAGVYGEWSFRGVGEGIKERFFRKRPGPAYEILPEIRNMVTFAHLNLVDDIYPALLNQTNAIDLILCRNVLMYFTQDCVAGVIGRLRQSLRPDGWLLVSPVETPLVDRTEFSPQFYQGAVLHRKAERAARDAHAEPADAVADGGGRQPIAEDRHPSGAPAEASGLGPSARQTASAAADLYARADYRGAAAALEGLASRPFAEASVFLLLARSRANLGELTQAAAWCEKAIQADGMDAASRYVLALVRIEQCQPDEAIAGLRKAIYLDPDFAMAHYTLANLYRRKRMYSKARVHLRNALALLVDYRDDEALPESEGMTAGNLAQVIASMRNDGDGHVR